VCVAVGGCRTGEDDDEDGEDDDEGADPTFRPEIACGSLFPPAGAESGQDEFYVVFRLVLVVSSEGTEQYSLCKYVMDTPHANNLDGGHHR
jgi:hypothetical protein